MGQAEESGEHPGGVCTKGVVDNSIFCVECHRWVHKRCSGISGKLTSNADYHCRRCLEGENGLFQSVLLKEVVIEPNVKLECVPKFCNLGRHTWGRKRGEESSKGQIEISLGKVQGVISYSEIGQGCIIPHKGNAIKGLCPECIDIWD